MLASISPLGERGRGNRWGRTVAAYVAGCTAAGLALGGGLGSLGALIRHAVPRLPVRALVMLVVASAGALDASRLRVPTVRRQVNENWLVRYRGWVYGAGFGFQLGLGVVTIVPTAAVYATFFLATLTASPWAGAVVGAAFGLVRGLPVVALGRVRGPEGLRRFHVTMQDGSIIAHRATVALLWAAAGCALLAP